MKLGWRMRWYNFWDHLPEHLYAALFCPVFGHTVQEKFTYTVCRHCRKILR